MAESNRPDEEFLNFMWPYMDHAMLMIRKQKFLIPFLAFEDRNGVKDMRHYMIGNSPSEAAAKARLGVIDLPSSMLRYALVYDGKVTIEGKKWPAILVEVGQRGSSHGFIFFQRFQPENNCEPIANPGTFGAIENWFNQPKKAFVGQVIRLDDAHNFCPGTLTAEPVTYEITCCEEIQLDCTGYAIPKSNAVSVSEPNAVHVFEGEEYYSAPWISNGAIKLDSTSLKPVKQNIFRGFASGKTYVIGVGHEKQNGDEMQFNPMWVGRIKVK